MTKLALTVSAIALFGFGAAAYAGDMKDQGPINTNPPAFGASAAGVPSNAVPAPHWGTGAGPLSKSPAYQAQTSAAPSNQLADNLRGRVYQAPNQ